jgi:hypothetical protein
MKLENFPNFVKHMDTHKQETFRFPNRNHQKRTSPFHIRVNIQKLQNKEGILKLQEKYVNTGQEVRITSALPAETLKARKA